MFEIAKPLRVMVLCGRSSTHLYVANALCQAADVVAIVLQSIFDVSWKKLAKMLRPEDLFRKAWLWLRDRRRCTGNAEAMFFFGERPPRLNRHDLAQAVPHISHPDTLQLAQQLKPDLFAVFGTSLIRGDLLKAGRLGMATLHGGLSPAYRGADFTFWPLYKGEPAKVGCTLHWIDAGIDNGGLIANVIPKVLPDDDELTLFWRAVQTSAETYAEHVQSLVSGERFGQTQRHKGRLYQVKQRGLREERVLSQKLQDGLHRGVVLGVRATWFPAAAMASGKLSR